MQNRFALAVVLTAGIFSSAAALAQTSEEQNLCMNDAFRVCSHTIPDRGRTFACMVQNKAQLSTGCQGVMDKYASAGGAPVQNASIPARATAPAAMRTRPAAARVKTAINNGRPGKPLNILMR
jgi:hypothetical protein